MALTLEDLCDGISDTLATATGIQSVKSFDELTTSIPADQCPRLQVYLDAINGSSQNEQTQQVAFNGGVQSLDIPIFVDLYARHRSYIWLDMKAMVECVDAITDVIQAQPAGDYFGVPEIQNFRWNFKRGVMQYGKSKYMGGRFTITARIF